jgi:hypothetical protein
MADRHGGGARQGRDHHRQAVHLQFKADVTRFSDLADEKPAARTDLIEQGPFNYVADCMSSRDMDLLN